MTGSIEYEPPARGPAAADSAAAIADPVVDLGCEICVRQEPAAWISERAERANALIRLLHLDNPDIRSKLLAVASDLCGLCAGAPERAENAATHARALFTTAVTPQKS
ncbi:hypothetical protein [Azospirillum sp.]|uniref:hypothetical protein n=1 Tax=Azospirillum sp. TaxID=34012 RepID=UPI002D589991|nr:hypothetical protein [Azospirillum sp.]HYD67011.1 hypothetical protein [Azospirillum sp.]